MDGSVVFTRWRHVHIIYKRQKQLTWQCPLVAGYQQYLDFVRRQLKPPP